MVVRFYSSTAAETTLSGTINSSATAITVASVTGFPVSFPYTLALDYESATEELVDVTAAAGTSLTITRAVDATSATSHNAGARVRHVSSARDFRDSRTHENNTAGVHGVTGNVVGTTDTQTLSNKTLINATGTLNRIDILAEGTPWVTTVNGDIDNVIDIMQWKRGPSETHEVAKVTNNGAVYIRNQNAGADTVSNIYRLRVTKDNGTTDIFSVLSGGSVVTWLDASQTGVTVVPNANGSGTATFQSMDSTNTSQRWAVFRDGHQVINGAEPAVQQLSVNAAPGQSVSIFRVRDGSLQTVHHVDQTGKTFDFRNADIKNDLGLASEVVLRVFANQTSQSGDLQQWVDDTNTIRARVFANGEADFNTSSATSGIFTASSGWSITDQQAVKKAGVITIYAAITRTGSNITSPSTGNLGDVAMATVAANWRPNAGFQSTAAALPSTITDGFGDGGSRLVANTGVLSLVSWTPNGVITTGRVYRFMMTYIA